MSHRLRPLFLLLLISFLEPVPSLAQVAWVKKFDDALKQAAVDKRFLIVDISASWCPFCRKMAREAYTDREYINFSRSQVFMRLYADTDEEGTRLARKFGVRSYPTILVLNASGQEIGRLMGARSAQNLIRELESIFDSSALDDESIKKEPGQTHAREPQNSAAVEAYNAGLALQKAGDKAKALEFYIKALAQDPKMIPALMNASIIYLEFKDFKNARSTLQKWVEADPQAAKPLAMQAQLERDSGNHETAVKQLQKAIALEQDEGEKAKYREMLLGMLSALSTGGSSSPKIAPTGVPAAPAGIEADKKPASQAVLAEVAKTDEKDPIARLEKKLASAKDAPERDWLHLMLGIAHFQAQHWKEAREYLAKVLEKDPDNLTAREMMKAAEKMQSPANPTPP